MPWEWLLARTNSRITIHHTLAFFSRARCWFQTEAMSVDLRKIAPVQSKERVACRILQRVWERSNAASFPQSPIVSPCLPTFMANGCKWYHTDHTHGIDSPFSLILAVSAYHRHSRTQMDWALTLSCCYVYWGMLANVLAKETWVFQSRKTIGKLWFQNPIRTTETTSTRRTPPAIPKLHNDAAKDSSFNHQRITVQHQLKWSRTLCNEQVQSFLGYWLQISLLSFQPLGFQAMHADCFVLMTSPRPQKFLKELTMAHARPKGSGLAKSAPHSARKAWSESTCLGCSQVDRKWWQCPHNVPTTFEHIATLSWDLLRASPHVELHWIALHMHVECR